MEKQIRVECTGAATLPLERISPLQGDLKTISPDKFKRLKASIIDYGISAPTQVWVDQDGVCYTLDGHQRLLAYKALQNEGWIIPEIPIVYVEAKEKLLVATSSYGEFSAAGVERYIQSLKNRDRIKKTINLSNVNLNRIYAVLNSHTDPDDVPVLTAKPTIAKQGDLWICGKHRIVCGDSRDKSVIDRFGIDHLENLNPYRQQAVLDLLLRVQDQTHLSSKDTGLIGCTVERFPVSEIGQIFKRNSPIAKTANRLLALQGLNENNYVNLKLVIETTIEMEITRRVEMQSEKTLFDFAENE